MIVSVEKKNGKKKIHYCDFCRETKLEATLKLTGVDRYSPEYGKFGKEAICKKCSDTLGRI